MNAPNVKMLEQQIKQAFEDHRKARRKMDENSRRAAREALKIWRKIIESPSAESWLAIGVAYQEIASSIAATCKAYVEHDLKLGALKAMEAQASALKGQVDA